MASRDRERVLADYAAKFDTCSNTEALVNLLGSPTKVAIDLAMNYAPAEPPKSEDAAIAELADEPSVETLETAVLPEVPEFTLEEALSDEDFSLAQPVAESVPEPAPEPIPAPEPEPVPVPEPMPVPEVKPEPTPAPEIVPAAPAQSVSPAKPGKAKKGRFAPGGFILFLILLLLIGIPVTVAVLCVGLPFLAGGAGLIALAVPFALRAISALKLIADLLLVFGGSLAASAIGLLLAAFGLWLSLTLAWLWLDKVVFRLGRRLCRKKEVPEV